MAVTNAWFPQYRDQNILYKNLIWSIPKDSSSSQVNLKTRENHFDEIQYT
jgi:hypothetical protein